MKRFVTILCALLLAGACKERTEPRPPTLEDIRLDESTFQPAATSEAAPDWVSGLRAVLDDMSAEGVAIGIADGQASDRLAWLIYDAELSPPNWIISEGGNLPAEEDALRTHLAYLRAHNSGPILVGYTPDGRLVDEVTAKTIASPLSISREGPAALVALNVVGADDWERTELPVVGGVRYKRSP